MTEITPNIEPLRAVLADHPKPLWVGDVDSTQLGVETLDHCARAVLSPGEMVNFEEVTDQGMGGTLGFYDSFTSRVEVLISRGVTREQVHAVGQELIRYIDCSALAQRERIAAARDRIYAVSGGIEDLIMPAMRVLGLHPDHIFTYDERGKISGFEERLTVLDDGKARQVADLGLIDFAVGIGDGYNDYLVREGGHVGHFVAYVAHKQHQRVVQLADSVADNFEVPIFT
jgi:D-3-phosphoglycerate dehydrogenase